MKEKISILLVLIIGLFVFMYSSQEVNAEETTEKYTYTFSYSYTETMDTVAFTPGPHSYVWQIESDYELHMFLYEDENGLVWLKWFSPDYETGNYTDKYLLINYNYTGYENGVYCEGDSYAQYYNNKIGNPQYITKVFNFAINWNSNSGKQDVVYAFSGNVFNSYDSAMAYCESGDESGLLKPSIEYDWETALENNTVALDGFSASYFGDTVATSWTGISSRKVDISNYENMYVLLSLGYRHGLSDEEIYHDTVFIKYSEMGGGVSVSKYLPSTDMELYSVKATLYYYSGDDISNTCYSCIPSYVFFGQPTFSENEINNSVNLGYLQDVTWDYESTKEFPYEIYQYVTWSVDVPDPDIQIEILLKDTDNNIVKTLHSYGDNQVYYNDGIFKIFTDSTGASEHDEIYIRKVKYDTDLRSYIVGGWTRIKCTLTDGNNITTGTMNRGDTETFEKDIVSDDSYDYGMNLDGSYGDKLDWTDNTAIEDMSINWLMEFMTGIVDSLGAVPKFISTIFGFLPTPIIYTLGALLVVCVLLRILGR